uniref:Uncharacterized protein n=2 Tax=Lutzomyia longipalpis TaxID=7200 RepID=A0A1B0C919_LUTLO
MSSQRTPPHSPKAPKIQQQSWDDCNTPPIDIFDPNHTSPPQSPSITFEPPPKSPKSPRKLPTSPIKGPKFDYPEAKSPTSSIHRSQYSSPHCSGYNYDVPPSPRGPSKSRKFIYDAVSPKYEGKGRKFDFPAEPLSHEEANFNCFDGGSMSSGCGAQPPSPAAHYRRHNGTRSKNYPMRVFDVRGGGENGMDFKYDAKRHSVVTESTLSGESELSTATTAMCSSTDCGRGGSLTKSESSALTDETSASKMGTSDAATSRHNSTEEQQVVQQPDSHHARRGNSKRRYAINITPNPGYQAIHKSHFMLDRTCSDSVVSQRCRKSTSDLTDSLEAETSVSSIPRRRGSSKGGLAYLASRRSSRESMKSAVSNSSIFSNEDIGPLAFQATSRGRQRRTSNFLELPVPDHIRPRVCSLPERPYNPRQSDDLYRLRTFSISKGTVVNCGDSIISRRSRSNTSVNSTTSRASERSPFDGSCCGGGYSVVDSLPPSPTDSEPPPPPRYRVVMLGDAGVGKTALVSQFMTSEYMHTYDASLVDDEFGEKTVSVLLDGEESEMVFIDHPTSEMSVENSLSTYEPHGCVVIYSVVTRSSFRCAEEIINYLWRENVIRDKAVILVGNKADLARSRVITTQEGKALAGSRDAKFIETSSGIQHNVDELLVGILKQIRLKETRDKKAAICATKMRNSRTHMSLHLAKEILQKICLSDISKSKSCENLHVL